MTRRETILTLAFAAWSLAIGISLAAIWSRPAPPGQLPGYATAQNFDAHAPFRFVLGITVCTLVLPLALRPITRRLASGAAWARHASIAATIFAVWLVTIVRDPLWTIVPAALTIATCTLLRARTLDFSRHDWILLPAFGATFMAMLDIARDLPGEKAVLVAAMIVFAVRIAVTFIRSPLAPAHAFLLAPLALTLQTSLFARDQRYFGWHALAVVVLTPFALRPFLRKARRATLIATLVVYPLAVYSYSNATSLQTGEGKPRVTFFEDSHSLPMASEYLRGERPYRDILPGHGLIEDGLFDYIVFQARGVTLGNTMRARILAGNLNAIGIYALGTAMTGVPEVGLLTYFLWALTSSTFTIRLTPALFTLALIVLAIRTRKPRWWIVAGLGTVICGITSLDYAAYTFLALVIAIVRFKPWRIAARAAGIGIAIAAVPLFLAFAPLGILDDFARSTFIEVMTLGPVYTLTMFTPPRSFDGRSTFPEVLTNVFHIDAFPYLVWCGVILATAVLLTRKRTRRVEPFVIVGLWAALAAISYGERHHLYFNFVSAAMIVPAAWVAFRRRWTLAPVLACAIFIAALPTTHIAVVGWIRRVRGPIEERWVEVRDVPRACGALLLKNEAESLAAAKKYVSLTLARDE
ncbi:MAG TPA: hypothetical protein VFN10_13655, partial [Thermoanaerobaculia bacterium]|nr:hypothetical protein [Thermoanaerobaculia bacterium]